MTKLLVTILLFCHAKQACFAQLVDDFSNSTSLDLTWEGDREKFRINTEERLQLADTEGGQAMLFSSVELARSQEWAMDIELDFSPSSSNRLEVFLAADFELTSATQGYVINLGQSGSEDALQFFEINNGERTLIAEGTNGLIAEGPVIITLKATLNENVMMIEVDLDGSECFLTEIETTVDTNFIEDEFFFGFICHYTSSRSDKFFWDNIYVGTLRSDLSPPRINFLNASANEIQLNFSEPINQDFNASAISVVPQPTDFNLSSTKNSVVLQTEVGWQNTVEYEIKVSGVEDLAGNQIDTTIFLEIPLDANEGDIFINEILFNPFGDGADYVEIINVSSGLVRLDNLFLTNLNNGDSDPLVNIPNIRPNELVVLTDDRNDIILRYPNHNPDRIFEMNIPRFNNTSGNVSLISVSKTLDSFDYDEDFHRALIDDVEGISLERISLEAPTNEPENWNSALASNGYGTPGLTNGNMGNTGETNDLQIENKVFSPNGDGDKDEVIINYQLDGIDYVGNVKIYNDQGKLIATPVKNELLTAEGSFIWNGQTDVGTLAPIGIYIVQIELFDLNGRTIQKKFSCGLGDFLN